MLPVPTNCCAWWIGCVLLVTSAAAFAQAPADSLREYDLGEVVVGGRVAERPASPSTLQRIPVAAIDRLDAPSVSDLARLVPAAHVQTNSRGETLVYLRAAGERQVALFFDGALLNIPWDNRIDLSLLPASVIGGVTVAKGVPSVLWGANVLGGAVNMTSRGLGGEGLFTEVTGQSGSEGFGQGTATHLGRRGPFSWVAAGSYARRDGFAVPGDLAEAGLIFSQPAGGVRTNTDYRLANGFARFAFEPSPAARIGLSVLHVDSEKGIAPEGHRDPDERRVRFWRYPTWRMSMAILKSENQIGPRTSFRGSVWGSRFRQEIDQFGGVAYADLRERQEDEDLTLGTRGTLEHRFAPVTLRLAASVLGSTHRQRDVDLEGGERAPRRRFDQTTGSFGVEAEGSPLPRLTLTGGASLDWLSTPATDDAPERDPLVDYGLTAGSVYRLSAAWSLRAASGRKTRFPTPRELLDDGLGRFALNPDLRPESSLLAEAGVRHEGEVVSGEATLFVNATDDTIDQRDVVLEGTEFRQRVNLGRSRILGVEVAGAVRPLARVRLDGHLTVMDVRGFEEDGTGTRLSEKPEAIGRLAATYTSGRGLGATAEAVYTGVAYSADRGRFVRLDPSLVLNLRVGYRLSVRAVSAEVFARVNNLTDAVVLPQLGLPGPGRALQAGLKLAL
ncbi:MAG: TonB-dependent receptor [Bacteroidota bacterium]